MAKRNTQLKLLKDQTKAYGGDLLKKRKARQSGRPLDTKHSMHLILRSTKARGEWSFWQKQNKEQIRQILAKFSRKYGVKIYSLANVGNHIHLHMKLSNIHTYNPFIRAITASIAMAVTGASRWNKLKKSAKHRFWDCRPYSRVVMGGRRAFFTLKDYILINQLEGYGMSRPQARFFIGWHGWDSG